MLYYSHGCINNLWLNVKAFFSTPKKALAEIAGIRYVSTL